MVHTASDTACLSDRSPHHGNRHLHLINHGTCRIANRYSARCRVGARRLKRAGTSLSNAQRLRLSNGTQ